MDAWIELIDRFGGLFLRGFWLTAQLTVAPLVVGFALAWPLAIVRAAGGRSLFFAPVSAFVYFMTGTPMLVQLFLLYYGLAQFEWIRESFLWTVFAEAYWCAMIAFTLNTAAYSAEIFRGAILATPKGEIDAARACGMGRAAVFWRAVFPSSMRRALPAYGNEMIFLMQGSAVASVVPLIDLTGAARNAFKITISSGAVLSGDFVVYVAGRNHRRRSAFFREKILPPFGAVGAAIDATIGAAGAPNQGGGRRKTSPSRKCANSISSLCARSAMVRATFNTR